ncbi:MAG: hypothetical protein O3A53_20860 [Acidobacteria bacterium]|nr:hypothetical protein [Acidobacteriota bacterium]MDA1237230.1 hypothetical protein [Acidobacteriota bacterium]
MGAHQGDIQNISPPRVDAARLRLIYRTSAVARWVLEDFAGRENSQRESSVDTLQERLESTGRSVDRRAIIDLFKQLSECGCGEFTVGRKGRKTRLRWLEDQIRVGKIAAGRESPLTGDPNSPAIVTVIETPPDSEFVAYPFSLRSDLPVTLKLPRDLRRSEAQRLGEFISAIALPDDEIALLNAPESDDASGTPPS